MIRNIKTILLEFMEGNVGVDSSVDKPRIQHVGYSGNLATSGTEHLATSGGPV